MQVKKRLPAVLSPNGSQSGAGPQPGVATPAYEHPGYIVPQTGTPPQPFPEVEYPEHIWPGGGALRYVGGLIRDGQVRGIQFDIEAWLHVQAYDLKAQGAVVMFHRCMAAIAQMDGAKSGYMPILSPEAQNVAALAYNTASAQLVEGMNGSIQGLASKINEIAAQHLDGERFQRRGFVFQVLDWLKNGPDKF